MSTGKCIKDGIAKGTTAIKCIEFDSSSTLLWTGDEKVVVIIFMLCSSRFSINEMKRCNSCINKMVSSRNVLTIWDKVFKSGPSKICGRQPLQTMSLQIF